MSTVFRCAVVVWVGFVDEEYLTSRDGSCAVDAGSASSVNDSIGFDTAAATVAVLTAGFVSGKSE